MQTTQHKTSCSIASRYSLIGETPPFSGSETRRPTEIHHTAPQQELLVQKAPFRGLLIYLSFVPSPARRRSKHAESDGLPGSIEGDEVKCSLKEFQAYTTTPKGWPVLDILSVTISFGIQPLIAARFCCFWRLSIQCIPDHTTFVAITITSHAAVGCRTWRRTESEIAKQDHRWGRCRQPSLRDRS